VLSRGSLKRRSLLAAVRDRMRDRSGGAGRPEPPPPAAPRPRPVGPDHELEQLAAEARYQRDRFRLYQARVLRGSGAVTSPARLRELERMAAAADERLAHARRAQSARDGSRV
jgi:hypothetical protein